MDRRPTELRHIGIIVDFLCDEYPNKFSKSEYTHPKLGVCKTLIIKRDTEKQVDYTRIDRIDIDIVNRHIVMSFNSPSEVMLIPEFFKDGTVM